MQGALKSIPKPRFQARYWTTGEDGAGSAGQMLMSKSLMEKDFERKGIPRQSEIICFCHGGVSSSHKYLRLKHAGYERVKVYDGSIMDWTKRGYPIR